MQRREPLRHVVQHADMVEENECGDDGNGKNENADDLSNATGFTTGAGEVAFERLDMRAAGQLLRAGLDELPLATVRTVFDIVWNAGAARA